MPDVRVTRVRHGVGTVNAASVDTNELQPNAHVRSINFVDADTQEHRSFESCVASLVDI